MLSISSTCVPLWQLEMSRFKRLSGLPVRANWSDGSSNLYGTVKALYSFKNAGFPQSRGDLRGIAAKTVAASLNALAPGADSAPSNAVDQSPSNPKEKIWVEKAGCHNSVV